jgi:hypothetical protein
MKGIDVSGQTTMSGRSAPSWTGGGRQREMVLEDRRTLAVVELLGLVDHRLDNADGHLRLERRRCRLGEPVKAESDMRREERCGDGETGARALARPDQSRRGEDENGQHVDRRKIDDAGRLHHQRHRHGRIADGIPREAGKEKTAQPFGDAEAERKGGDPAPTIRPEAAGNDDRQRGKRARERPGGRRR